MQNRGSAREPGSGQIEGHAAKGPDLPVYWGQGGICQTKALPGPIPNAESSGGAGNLVLPSASGGSDNQAGLADIREVMTGAAFSQQEYYAPAPPQSMAPGGLRAGTLIKNTSALSGQICA